MSYLSLTHSSMHFCFLRCFSLFFIRFFPLLRLSYAVSCQSLSGLFSMAHYVRIMIAMRLIFSIFIHVEKIFSQGLAMFCFLVFILDCQGMKKGLFLVSIMSFSSIYSFAPFSPKNHWLRDFSIL